MLTIAPLQVDLDNHEEGRDYKIHNGYIWFCSATAAELLNIDRNTLNRDCRLALQDEPVGNLKGLAEYILEDFTHARREWWVRHDINRVYFMSAPGKGRNRTRFPVACLQKL